MAKTFRKLEARTILDIWMPRYSSAYSDAGERVALLACYKVQQAAPWVVIRFTKAKHLIGQRYCISRAEAMKCAIDSNGKIPCYAVGMSQLIRWDLEEEIIQAVNELW